MNLISTKKAYAMILAITPKLGYELNQFNENTFTPVINTLTDKIKGKQLPVGCKISGTYYKNDCYCTLGAINYALDKNSLSSTSKHNLIGLLCESNFTYMEASTVLTFIARLNDALPDTYSVRQVIELFYWLANSMDDVAVNFRSRITVPALKQMIITKVKT